MSLSSSSSGNNNNNNNNQQQQSYAGNFNFEKYLSNYQKADGWYLGSIPPMGANVAYTLYGVRKQYDNQGNQISTTSSPCSAPHYITSLVTMGGVESMTNVLATLGIGNFVYQYQNSNNNNNNKNGNNRNDNQGQGMRVSSACVTSDDFELDYDNYYDYYEYSSENSNFYNTYSNGNQNNNNQNNNNNDGSSYYNYQPWNSISHTKGGYQFTVQDGYSSYGTVCSYTRFVTAKFRGALCVGSNVDSVSDYLENFNKAIQQVGCVAIYDSSKASGNNNNNNNQQNSNQLSPVESLLSTSQNCVYQNVCPDPHGILEDDTRALARVTKSINKFSRRHKVLRRSAWFFLVVGMTLLLIAVYSITKEVVIRRKLKKKWKRNLRKIRPVGSDASDFTDFDLPYVEKTPVTAVLELSSSQSFQSVSTRRSQASSISHTSSGRFAGGASTNTSVAQPTLTSANAGSVENNTPFIATTADPVPRVNHPEPILRNSKAASSQESVRSSKAPSLQESYNTPPRNVDDDAVSAAPLEESPRATNPSLPEKQPSSITESVVQSLMGLAATAAFEGPGQYSPSKSPPSTPDRRPVPLAPVYSQEVMLSDEDMQDFDARERRQASLAAPEPFDQTRGSSTRRSFFSRFRTRSTSKDRVRRSSSRDRVRSHSRDRAGGVEGGSESMDRVRSNSRDRVRGTILDRVRSSSRDRMRSSSRDRVRSFGNSVRISFTKNSSAEV